jgi:pyridoxal phosphate enzyme (YggS family)
MTPDQIADNIFAVRQRMESACERSGRPPQSVRLIAVSKTMSAETVAVALALGVQDFGENRLEEALGKMFALDGADAPHWHMLGHVQSRKAKEVVQAGFSLIHSLDTLKLAHRYDRFALEFGVSLPVLLEVNVSGEASKAGWQIPDWESDKDVRARFFAEAKNVLQCKGLVVRGLMTMAPYEVEPEKTRPVFRCLARLRDALQEELGQALPELSMGMTNDYDIAIEEGATLVRIGRAIFGEREAKV